MSEQPVDQFLTLTFFKTIIKSTDTQDDNQYLSYVNDANRKVESAISRYITVPIGTGSIYFSRCHDAALAFARSLLSEDIELVQKAEHYTKKYNIALYGDGGTESIPMAGGIIQEMIGDRTDKTKVVQAVYDPRQFKVVLPSQLDLASTERYQ